MWRKLRFFFGRHRFERELEEEMQLHLELSTGSRLDAGLDREAARREALRRFGNPTLFKEEAREMWAFRVLDELAQDLRYGLRMMRRSRGFTAVAIVTLGLGIGASTAIFSLADAVLLRTLPVANPRELVLLRRHGPSGGGFPFTSAAAADLAQSRDVLSGLAIFRPGAPNTSVGVDGETEIALVQMASGNYHAVLGVRALLGRTLFESDRDPIAVISHRYWQRRFGGDPNVVGRLVEMQGRSFTIVGVTPREFYGTQPGRSVDLTAPLAAQTMTMPPAARWLYLIGRLRPGVSREQAQAALRVRWAQLAAANPASRPRAPETLELDSGAQGLNELRRQFSTPLRILMAAVGVVLLVACANLASLLIARSSARQQEIAVRLSLGAARGRIVRQLLTESALLAAAGGAAGTALAYWAADLLVVMMSRGRSPIVLDVAPDARALGFAAAATLVTAVLFGLLPALGASRTDTQPALKQSAETARSRWMRAMVAAQVALLVLLLTTAGLFARTLGKLRAVDAGFRQEQVLVVNVSRGSSHRGARARALYEELYARFSALPQVRAVSMSMDTPLGGLSAGAGIEVPGRPAEPDAPQVYHNFVGPHFFETMGIPVLSGRDFDLGDDDRAPQRVVVSESVARRYFPNEDPLGRRIVLSFLQKAEAEIVGVCKDVRYESLRKAAPQMIYRPHRQVSAAPGGPFLLRTSADPALLTPFLQAEVRAVARELPPPSVLPLAEQVDAALVEERMLAALSSVFGALAAILAGVGIYGTVAYAVVRRTREIGIRMALGARPGEVARMVVAETSAVVAVGLAAGIPAALAAGHVARGVLSGVLFQLSPADPLTIAASAGAILAIASLAAYLPARRAARIDPVAAVRYE